MSFIETKASVRYEVIDGKKILKSDLHYYFNYYLCRSGCLIRITNN